MGTEQKQRLGASPGLWGSPSARLAPEVLALCCRLSPALPEPAAATATGQGEGAKVMAEVNKLYMTINLRNL